jgi:pSer/pThr/pTyr-binding forkhead associated (FHA) protein
VATQGNKSANASLSSAALPLGDATDPQATLPTDGGDPTQSGVTNESRAPALFKLLVLAGPKAGSEFLIDTDDFTVGRAVENIVAVPDVSVSRRHARFVRRENGFEVSDLQSGNGVKLNGKPITSATVAHGDELILGDTVLQVIDLSAPLPERMKPIHTLQSPSGSQGAPNTTTEVENLKVANTPARVEAPAKTEAKPVDQETKAAVVAPKDPPKKPAAPSGGNNRMKVYLGIGALMVVFFAVAAIVKKPQGPIIDDLEDPSLAKWPEEVFKARDCIVKRHDWECALKELEPLRKSDEPVAKEWIAAVTKEVEFQKKLKNATAALNGLNFRDAIARAKEIPEEADLYPQAQELLASIKDRIATSLNEARSAFTSGNRDRANEILNAILSFDPNNADAQLLKAEVNRPVVAVAEPAKGPKGPVEPAKGPSDPTPVKADPFAGPWRDAYLDGRLPDALRAAEAAEAPEIRGTFLQLLQKFQTKYREGMQAAESRRVPQAADALSVALGIDKQLAAGLPIGTTNRPGREVRKQLANMEYILSLDCKGDDQLGLRAKHLRIALDADPSHELSLKVQKETFDRARAVYTESYVDKANDPDRAKRGFKIVISTLPEGDETRRKAENLLNQMK